MGWRTLMVSGDAVLERIRPGMSLFLSTGAAEPRTLVKHLMASHSANLQDLELIQIVSFADAISLKNLQSQNQSRNQSQNQKLLKSSMLLKMM